MIRKLLLVSCVATITMPAWAQDSGQRDDVKVAALTDQEQVRPRRRDGSDIIVTGQRETSSEQVAEDARAGILEGDVFSTPFSTKAYTAELIRDQGARNINDVVANDPSVRISLNPTFVLDQASIRGFLVIGSSYLFDGLPNLTPNYGTAPVAHFERVNILKGPASALTAVVGTVGGAIDLTPKRAGDAPVTSLTAGVQSDLLATGHADVGRRFGRDGMFGVRVNLSGETGQLYDGSDRDQAVASVAFDARLGPVRAIIDAGYQEYQSQGLGINFTLAPGAQLPAVPSPRTARAPDLNFFHDKSWFGLGTLEVDLAEGWTARVRYGGSEQRMESSNFVTGPLDSQGGFSVTALGYRPWRNSERVAEVALRGRLRTGPITHELVATGLRLTGGLSAFGSGPGTTIPVTGLPRGSIYLRYSLADPFANGLPPRVILPVAQPTLESIAIADDMSLADDRVRVIVGARRQRLRQVPYDQTKTTPTVAVLVKPFERLSLYANYAEALSQGAVAPNNASNPGEQLPPYVSRQYEIGAKYDGGGFGMTLAAFDIAQDFALLDPTNRFVVGGQQRNRGVELETFGEPVRGLRLLGGIAYIDGVQRRTQGGLTDGRKALGVPEWTANVSVEHDLAALPGLTLTARGITTSRSFVNVTNTQEVPGWERADLFARYGFGSGGTRYTLRGGVLNAFDGRYWATGARNIIVLASPRTWFLSGSVDF